MSTSVERSCVFGVDLGTSALKLVAVSREGRVIASARESYPTFTSCAGQAEQNCGDWLKALSRATRKVHRDQKLRVEAIGLTGQMPTLVVLDASQPMGNAITWQDSRADTWVGERLNKQLRDEIYHTTGVILDGRYLAPMFHFHHRQRSGRPVILSAKDFLFYALTGAFATDPSTASGYGVYNLKRDTWDGALCKLWNIPIAQLPSIMSSSSSMPLTRIGGKLVHCAPGIPVVLGCADSAAGVYALNGGVLDNEAANILTGSSTVIIKCDSTPHWDPHRRYLVTPLAGDHTYGREADLLASGSAREWVQQLFAAKSDTARRSIWKSAYQVAPGADGLLFAPYLASGEQGVLWNPDLRGALVGLTCAHGPAHIARALLEGMSFEIRRCLEVFETEPIASVRVSGWLTQSAPELQILSDVLGRPVHAFELESASALGVALLTGLVDRQKYFSKRKAVVRKPTKHSDRYNELYARYVAHFPADAHTTAEAGIRESSRRAQ